VKQVRTTSLGLAIFALFAIGVAGATPALAAEGPFFKIAGARLVGAKMVKAKESEEYVFKIAFTGLPVVRCKEMAFANGAEIKGLNKKESDTGTETINFKMCTVEKNGTGCTVENSEIKTQPLVDVLAYSELERKGKVLIMIHPATAKTIAVVKFVGVNCVIKEGQLEGNFAGEMLDGSRKSIAVEGTQAEAMINFVKFPTGQITVAVVEIAEVEKGESVKLSFSIGGIPVEATITGESELETAPKENWSVYTK
jgi:hypothetical protein